VAVTARLATDYPATNQLKAGIVVPHTRSLSQRIQDRRDFFFTLDRVPEYLGDDARSQRDARAEPIRHAIGASRGRLAGILSEAIVLAGQSLRPVVLFNAPGGAVPAALPKSRRR
jgi:hypothetical protein